MSASTVERGVEKRYTIPEAAEALRCSPDFIRDAVKSGALPAKKVKRITIRASDLDAWYDTLPDAEVD